MATVTLNFPTGQTARIIHGLCAGTGQPLEDAAHAKQAVLDWITATVQNVEQSEAQAAVVVPDVAPVSPS